MKIHMISDIHLEGYYYDTLSMPDADVLVLAGDIVRLDMMDRCNAQGFFNAVTKKYKRIIVIDGNHEYYRSDFYEAKGIYRDFLAQFDNVERLDNNNTIIDDVLFIGSTLWTNFSTPEVHASSEVIEAATKGITDFHAITVGKRNFLPMDAFNQFADAWQYIALTKDWNERNDPRLRLKTVVVTHFCPSKKSIHPKWGDDPLNHYFASDVEDLMPGVDLWIHGHTHSSFDYMVGDCRVVCNPKGYGKENVIEFNPMKVIEI